MLVKNMKHVGLIVRLEGGMQALQLTATATATAPKEVVGNRNRLADRMLCYYWRVESVLHQRMWCCKTCAVVAQDVVLWCNTMGCAV